jgi:hypothetical protein
MTITDLAGSYRIRECETIICCLGSATKKHYLIDTATHFPSIKGEQWNCSKCVFRVMNQPEVILHGTHPLIILIL